MDVRMKMRLSPVVREIMFVLMMLVVAMAVCMFYPLMCVLMLMSFSDVKPDA